ncbi:MAG TPA: paraquat-inducible protein A [Steroidobacteraceae bacterium]|nr:paraquat-inducible protein A [Steroidobacteraceae bacterium]
MEILACPDCGLRQCLPPRLPDGWRAQCGRCRRPLARPSSHGLDLALAAAAAALLVWIPACLAPIMRVSTEGVVRESGLGGNVAALWSGGFPSLALIVGAFSIAAPWIYLLLVTVVLVGVHVGGSSSRSGATASAGTPVLGILFRWALYLRPWTMIEVYLLGACVAYSRIEKVAFVTIGTGGWCLLTAAILLLVADALLDERAVWAALPIRGPGARSRVRPVAKRVRRARGPAAPAACTVCELAAPGEREGDRCPRCRARVAARKHASLERTTALVACGFLLFIPANLLPVLTIDRLGHEQASTILGGVFELAHDGLWPLAVIVFTASIAIPLAKLAALSWNLVLTRRGSARFLVARTHLHRAIDLIGRWSNIDVFMVSILLALVQFGALTRVRVDPGMIAFAAVVIVTMIAAKCFDSRLMWDAAERRE